MPHYTDWLIRAARTIARITRASLIQLVMPTTAVVTLLTAPALTVQSRGTKPIHGGRSILDNQRQSTEWISPPVATLVGKLR